MRLVSLFSSDLLNTFQSLPYSQQVQSIKKDSASKISSSYGTDWETFNFSFRGILFSSNQFQWGNVFQNRAFTQEAQLPPTSYQQGTENKLAALLCFLRPVRTFRYPSNRLVCLRFNDFHTFLVLFQSLFPPRRSEQTWDLTDRFFGYFPPPVSGKPSEIFSP